MPELPSGTVTFLFTDVEGSTRLWEEHPEEMKVALGRHDQILRQVIEDHEGYVFTTAGDAFAAAFQGAKPAVGAAIDLQLAIAQQQWGETSVRVRTAVHTGEAEERDADYFGPPLNRAARLMSVAHGGQVLLSQATWDLVQEDPPEGADFTDLGEHRLKDLRRAEHVYQLIHPDLPSVFPELLSLNAVPNNLPVQLTSFLGRDRDLANGVELLGRNRLLTFTGPGGTGKTRLAIQVAAEAAQQFKHGVFFVPLAPIADPELVPSAIATSLALTQLSGPPLDHVKRYLADKQMLLVLDNFEQLLPAASQVSELLQAVPGLKTLVTSRAVLHVSGEQELPVPPLAVPDLDGPQPPESLADYAAVALFVERASAARPDFRLTAGNAPAVAAITVQLDGLPLAIELAAVRVRLLSPEAIASRLKSRLELLSGGVRDLPERQQTLRDTISWSYDLLSEPGQRLLARLSVFRAGVSLTQAEQVCGPSEELGVEVLEGLEMLIDQSLLRALEAAEEPRVLMLETIREFALERLEEFGEIDEIRRRHAFAYLELAKNAEPHLLYRGQVRWLEQLELEHDNLRAAIDWALAQQETDVALRLGFALWRFWQIRGHLYEAAERLSETLALPGGDLGHRAKALEAAGGLAYWQGDMESARDLYQQSLDLMRNTGDQEEIANALCNLGYPYAFGSEGDLEKADQLYSESLAISQELGDQVGIAKAVYGLAGARWIAGNWSQARKLFDESRQLFQELDEPFHSAWASYMLGNVEVSDGRPEVARPLLEEGIQLFAEVGDITGVLFHVDLFTTLALQDGQEERAVRLLGAANRLRETSGAGLAEVPRRDLPGLDDALDALGFNQAEALLAEGQAMSLDEIVTYVLDEIPESKRRSER
ncbi:MAG: tetratricopeptide repeat protein [Acidimicrobiia bacterium]